MSIGVEINGGGNNIINGVSVQSNNGNSKAVVINNSSNNHIQNIQLIDEVTLEHLHKLKNEILSIQDASTNPITGHSFQEEVLNKLNSLIVNHHQSSSIKDTLLELSSLLSNWITIKNELAPQLIPYLILFQTIIGG
ncbi:hypothetical protein [Psychrobacter pygoscelis]|uniref:hypothetical protein n=1 Tax=Psychrobacter pygoscelis TaxID=2488563 RepID=UPI00103CB0EF|nr:hypothetical protein [Psychrobacter pygoscelis]